MIRMENVTKYYLTARGRHYVFRNVTLEFPDGVNIAIIGRNGAGKTTLLRLLAGADTPNEGRIIRRGRISWPLGLTAGVQRSLTGAENARFACRIVGVPPEEVSTKIAEIEQFAELGKFFNLPVGTYSSGMKGRIKFAIAMAFDFDTYLIDELTATGDMTFNEKARAAFQAKRDRASFIKCTHRMEELINDCDAGILLDQGKLTYFSDVEDAARAYLAIVAPGDDELVEHELRRAEKKMSRGEAAVKNVDPDTRTAKRRAKRKPNGTAVDAYSPAPTAALVLSEDDEILSRRVRRRGEKKKERAKERSDSAEPRRRGSNRRTERRSREGAPDPHVPAPMAPRIPLPVASHVVNTRLGSDRKG
jgi:capsular polysaccharide transport system ATP-binding protein